MEVCRGNAPRSQLYESRASLTTPADRKTGSPGGSCTPDVPKSRAALASGRYKLLVMLLILRDQECSRRELHAHARRQRVFKAAVSAVPTTGAKESAG